MLERPIVATVKKASRRYVAIMGILEREGREEEGREIEEFLSTHSISPSTFEILPLSNASPPTQKESSRRIGLMSGTSRIV